MPCFRAGSTCRRILPLTNIDGVMMAALLVIKYHGTESMSVHESVAMANASLAEFVEARQLEQFGSVRLSDEYDADALVAHFFADPGDLFIIAEVDLSDLEEKLEALCRDADSSAQGAR